MVRAVVRSSSARREAINAARVRLALLAQQLREIVPTWTMVPGVAAYQALRGVSGHPRASATGDTGEPLIMSNSL
jgi:hypothetical protein